MTYEKDAYIIRVDDIGYQPLEQGIRPCVAITVEFMHDGEPYDLTYTYELALKYGTGMIYRRVAGCYQPDEKGVYSLVGKKCTAIFNGYDDGLFSVKTIRAPRKEFAEFPTRENPPYPKRLNELLDRSIKINEV